MRKIENKSVCCPDCGGHLTFDHMYQVSRKYKVLKNGRICKTYKQTEPLDLEAEIVYCENCGRNFNENDFYLSDDDRLALTIAPLSH